MSAHTSEQGCIDRVVTSGTFSLDVLSVVPDVEELHIRLVSELVNNPPADHDALADLMERTGAE